MSWIACILTVAITFPQTTSRDAPAPSMDYDSNVIPALFAARTGTTIAALRRPPTQSPHPLQELRRRGSFKRRPYVLQ